VGNSLEEVVVDTGPIINLGHIRSIELLDIFEKIIIPETVLAELSKVKVPDGMEQIDYIQETGGSDSQYDLDPGETAAVEIAEEKESTVLTDDLEARQKAQKLGIETHGSIGVITINQQNGKLKLDQAEKLMKNLQQKSALYTKDYIIEKAIKKLNQS
jgi:predicted nucleic acid-binding protein